MAEKASSDGATNKQCLIDDQKDTKTTITKLSTDLVDIPKPIDVAEEASTDGTMNVQCLSDDQNYKKMTNMKMPMDYLEVPEPSLTRGFLELAEEARNVCVENEQCLYTDEILPQVAGMTRPVAVTIAEYSHSLLNDGATIAPRIFTEMLMPVLPAGRFSPVDKMGQAGPGDETDQSVLSGSETEDRRTDPVGPVGPYVTFDQVQPVDDGPLGPYITLSPVGSDGKHSPCDILSPVGPGGTLSQCKPDQPVADGPVGPSVTLGPVGPGGTLSQCKPDQPVADGPVGSTDELGLVGLCGKLLRIDIKAVVTTDEPANLIGTSPSSDSGIHSLGEQWEDTSLITTDTEEEQNSTSQIHTPTGRRVSDIGVPPNTEEDQVTLCPWIDCLLNQGPDESSEIDRRNNDRDPEWNGTAEFYYSDQELTTDESSWEDYEPWSNNVQDTSVMRDPVDPPEMSHLHKRNSAEQYEDESSVYAETDGGNSDICNLADFSSDEEDIPVERNSGCQSENMIDVTTCNYSDLSDSEDSEWEDAENRAVRSMVEHYNFDLVDGMTPMEYVPIPRESRRKWPKEDLIYRPKLREPDIEYCASVFHTELASPRLETAVPPPVSVDVEVPSCREIKRDSDPGPESIWTLRI